MARKNRKFKMKMMINAVQNNDYVLFIKPDGDFLAKQRNLYQQYDVTIMAGDSLYSTSFNVEKKKKKGLQVKSYQTLL